MDAVRPPSFVGEIFSQKEWDKYYAKEDLPCAGTYPRVAQLPIHYSIALQRPESEIVEQIQDLKRDRTIAPITAQDWVCFKLTPLHMAAMRGLKEVVKALVNSIISEPDPQVVLNAQDANGWTPAHHAVLSSAFIFDLLVKQGADQNIRTHLGATSERLRYLKGEKIDGTSVETTFYRTPEGVVRKISDFSAEVFKELLGFNVFTDHPIFPPQTWVSLWRTEEPPRDGLKQAADKFIQNKFIEWKLSKPKLYISACPELAVKTSRPLGLFAEFIPKGTIIGPYAGEEFIENRLQPLFMERFSSEYSEDVYSCGNKNAKSLAHATRFANSGLPNACVRSIYIDGVCQQVLIALEDINGQILWDYGLGLTAMAFGPYTLFDREKMQSYYAKQPLSELFLEWKRHADLYKADGVRTPQLFLDYEFIECRITYPLNNPSILLDLHFNGIIRASEWINCAGLYDGKNPYNAWSKMMHFYPTSLVVNALISELNHFDNILSKNQEYRKLVYDWAKQLIGTLDVMQILKGLEVVTLLFNEGYLQKSDFFERFAKSMQSYDWKKDEQAPLKNSRLDHDKEVEYIRKMEQLRRIFQQNVRFK